MGTPRCAPWSPTMAARDPFAYMDKDPFSMDTLLKQPKKRKKKRTKLATPSTPGKKRAKSRTGRRAARKTKR